MDDITTIVGTLRDVAERLEPDDLTIEDANQIIGDLAGGVVPILTITDTITATMNAALAHRMIDDPHNGLVGASVLVGKLERQNELVRRRVRDLSVALDDFHDLLHRLSSR